MQKQHGIHAADHLAKRHQTAVERELRKRNAAETAAHISHKAPQPPPLVPSSQKQLRPDRYRHTAAGQQTAANHNGRKQVDTEELQGAHCGKRAANAHAHHQLDQDHCRTRGVADLLNAVQQVHSKRESHLGRGRVVRRHRREVDQGKMVRTRPEPETAQQVAARRNRSGHSDRIDRQQHQKLVGAEGGSRLPDLARINLGNQRKRQDRQQKQQQEVLADSLAKPRHDVPCRATSHRRTSACISGRSSSAPYPACTSPRTGPASARTSACTSGSRGTSSAADPSPLGTPRQ